MGRKGVKCVHKPHMNKMERIDMVRDTFSTVAQSELYKSMRRAWENEKKGLGRDIQSFIESCIEASNLVSDDPDILDYYSIVLVDEKNEYDRIKEGGRILTQTEMVIYLMANPWKVATDIIGMENLNKATVMASRFTSFTKFQKQFLRDFLDPRVNNMIFIACRSAGKTWLTALAMLISHYLMPHSNTMVVSGSQEQSDNLYRYYTEMTTGTRYEEFIERRTRTKTYTIAGGWIRSFPASHKAVHGPRPDRVIIDEACKAESDIIMAALSAAMSAQRPKFAVMTTPDKMVHIVRDWWLEAEAQERMTPAELATVPQQARWKKYHLSAFDCKWIKPVTIENLTYKYGGKNTHEYKIYVLGEFAPAEGLVFDEEAIMASLISELPKTVIIDVELEDGSIKSIEEEASYSFYTTGLDAGGKHPSGIVTACEDQVGNVYIIDDSEVNARTGDSPIITEVYRHARKYWSQVYADAAPIQYFLNQKIRSQLQEDGLPGLTVIPFNSTKLPMISAVKGLFEAGMLFILGKPGGPAETLVNQLLTYSYDDRVDSEMPMKGNDDHVDAFLLACWPHRNTFLNRKYKKATTRVYNMNEVLEEQEPDQFRPLSVGLTNPFNRT